MSKPPDDPRPALDMRDIRPAVRLPGAGLSGFGIATICGVLGLFLFFTLDANRRAMSSSLRQPIHASSYIASPPPLAVPPALAAPAPELASGRVTLPSPVVVASKQTPTVALSPMANAFPFGPPPPPLPMASVQPPAGASADKVIVMDMGRGDLPGAASQSGDGAKVEPVVGDDQAVRATVIRARSSLVPQGTLVPAVLETPIDSTRGGLVRALVSRDVRGFDGARVLIPRGSRLLGEAKGDTQPGQKRVLVTWSRLIRPDGVAIRIGSPGADNLGGAGLRGRVNTHFAERFANSVLQSALAIGVNLASRPRDGSVIVGVPGQLGGTLSQMPIFDVPKGPTIKVAKGAEIAVFVARDLDFGGTVSR